MSVKSYQVIAIGVAVAMAVIASIIFLPGSNVSQTNLQQNPTSNHKIKVVASFFPLYDFARHIGGDRADAIAMVPIGAEPHDWEPTVQQVQDMLSADVFVFNGAGIDKWADRVDSKIKVNASQGLQLLVDSAGQSDPHTWLDPIMAKHQIELIRDGMIQADPQNADYYTQNAKNYLAQIDSLNKNITDGLTNCKTHDFIAFHKAFSYFSNRYNLTQHSLLGEDPEGEIPPQTLQQMIDLAKQNGIHVIYSEELLDPRLANVVASSIPDGKNEVLSPIEGLKPDEQKAGWGYIDKMNMNLKNLREGLECQ